MNNPIIINLIGCGATFKSTQVTQTLIDHLTTLGNEFGLDFNSTWFLEDLKQTALSNTQKNNPEFKLHASEIFGLLISPKSFVEFKKLNKTLGKFCTTEFFNPNLLFNRFEMNITEITLENSPRIINEYEESIGSVFKLTLHDENFNPEFLSYDIKNMVLNSKTYTLLIAIKYKNQSIDFTRGNSLTSAQYLL